MGVREGAGGDNETNLAAKKRKKPFDTSVFISFQHLCSLLPRCRPPLPVLVDTTTVSSGERTTEAEDDGDSQGEATTEVEEERQPG